jgi:hypothetical protein
MDLWQPVKSALDWKEIRDAHVPEVSADDPVVARVRAELDWLEKHPAPEGNDPIFGKPYTEIQKELRQYLLDDIERYRWRKAGFNVTQDILDMVREEGE